MKRVIVSSFIILFLFTGCASTHRRVGATVVEHRLSGIDIERKTEKIKMHTPRVLWRGKDPANYSAMDKQKIKILQQAFNEEVADAGYFEIYQRSSQGNEFIDITLTIGQFDIQLTKEDGFVSRSGKIRCNLKVIDEGSVLGSSKDNFTESSELRRAAEEDDAAELPGVEESMTILARDIAKKLAKEITPTKKKVFRVFETGGSSDNSQGVKAAMNGNWKSALDLWNEAIHQCSSCPQSYFNKGLFYEMGGDTKQAQRFYNIAFELSPENEKYSRVKGEIDHEVQISHKYEKMNTRKKKDRHDTGGF